VFLLFVLAKLYGRKSQAENEPLACHSLVDFSDDELDFYSLSTLVPLCLEQPSTCRSLTFNACKRNVSQS
jgi:hypothetical protein